MDGAYQIRKVVEGDFHRGHMPLLAQLTSVGDITAEQYAATLSKMEAKDSQVYVVHDAESDRIVASATLLVEQKLIHECACVGHIEDVVVSESCRGKGVGQTLVRFLVDLAKSRRCYKVVLDCATENCGFYEKCGFVKRECQMRRDC
uniref:Glucosamine 6-phosphate N-acetyltransferase n=1 Tax=Neobodo designis TaxID=312471 RepID=A0A7S1R0A6_NEODS|mmetsp:Transcript_5865/g.18489  ORF Transcript_5865/g.18489 Transcript_5865/m.18489 type:complete len:147 (+) Transcript_5865:35-475(+)